MQVLTHALFDMPHLHLVCGQGGCPSSFTTFNSYRKHLLNQHPQEEPEPEVVQGMEGLVDADLGVAVVKCIILQQMMHLMMMMIG